MALINCPECKKEISEYAVSCPNCGCPSSGWATPPSQASPHFAQPTNAQRLHNVLQVLKKIDSAPRLRTVNGMGQTIFGKLQLPGTNIYVATTWFCLLFIPLIPTGIYLVEDDSFDSYKFYGNISATDFFSIFTRKEICGFAISILFSSALRIAIFAAAVGLVFVVMQMCSTRHY